jgi:hypothetical protein
MRPKPALSDHNDKLPTGSVRGQFTTIPPEVFHSFVQMRLAIGQWTHQGSTMHRVPIAPDKPGAATGPAELSLEKAVETTKYTKHT